MYDAQGEWHCERFEDCFVCPYPDCLQGTERIPKIDIRPDKYTRLNKNPKRRKKARYEQLKNLGICPRCRGKAAIGKVYCLECQTKSNIYAKKYLQKKGAFEKWVASRKKILINKVKLIDKARMASGEIAPNRPFKTSEIH